MRKVQWRLVDGRLRRRISAVGGIINIGIVYLGREFDNDSRIIGCGGDVGFEVTFAIIISLV